MTVSAYDYHMSFFSVVGKLLGLVPGVVTAVEAIANATRPKKPLVHMWTHFVTTKDPKTGEIKLREVDPEICRFCKRQKVHPYEFGACPGGNID